MSITDVRRSTLVYFSMHGNTKNMPKVKSYHLNKYFCSQYFFEMLVEIHVSFETLKDSIKSVTLISWFKRKLYFLLTIKLTFLTISFWLVILSFYSLSMFFNKSQYITYMNIKFTNCKICDSFDLLLFFLLTTKIAFPTTSVFDRKILIYDNNET